MNDGETLRAPPVGCDARQEKEEQVEMQGDYVLAYTNEWVHLSAGQASELLL